MTWRWFTAIVIDLDKWDVLGGTRLEFDQHPIGIGDFIIVVGVGELSIHGDRFSAVGVEVVPADDGVVGSTLAVGCREDHVGGD